MPRISSVSRVPTETIDVADIETRNGDYLSERDFVDVLRDIDAVLIISSPMGPDDRITMHRNVINGAKKAGVRKLLYTSVIGNGREAGTLYAPTAAVNRQAESDLQASGLDWVTGRNGLYFETDVEHIINAAETGVFRNNGGHGRCTYITRDEMAVAWAKLATDDAHNGKIFNLVGESKSQPELVAYVNSHLGLNVRPETIGDDEFRASVPSERGELVATMITGCYQCVRVGAFDVESDFEAGRPPKSVSEMVREYCLSRHSSTRFS